MPNPPKNTADKSALKCLKLMNSVQFSLLTGKIRMKLIPLDYLNNQFTPLNIFVENERSGFNRVRSTIKPILYGFKIAKSMLILLEKQP